MLTKFINNKNKEQLALIFILFFSLLSCSNNKYYDIQSVNANKFKSLVLSEGVILDVRTENEFKTGHINNAVNIDFYDDNFSKRLAFMNKDMPVYVYCKSGGRSMLASKKMKALGFSQVYNLKGGVASWKSLNYNLTPNILLQGNPSKSSMVSVSSFKKIIDDNNIVFISFMTEWCPPCKKMKPVILKMQKIFPQVKFLFIDGDRDKLIIENYNITVFPTFVIYNNSTETYRNTGIVNAKKLNQVLRLESNYE